MSRCLAEPAAVLLRPRGQHVDLLRSVFGGVATPDEDSDALVDPRCSTQFVHVVGNDQVCVEDEVAQVTAGQPAEVSGEVNERTGVRGVEDQPDAGSGDGVGRPGVGRVEGDSQEVRMSSAAANPSKAVRLIGCPPVVAAMVRPR